MWRLREFPDQRMFTSARAYNQKFHPLGSDILWREVSPINRKHTSLGESGSQLHGKTQLRSSPDVDQAATNHFQGNKERRTPTRRRTNIKMRWTYWPHT